MYFMFNHNKKSRLSRLDGGTRFTCDIQPNGCFMENMKNHSKLIAKGKRIGRMFTLDVNMFEVNFMLFTHGKGAGNIGIWHKQVGHVNLQRVKLMEKQKLVGSLSKFGLEEVISEVCETFQLGK